MEGRNDNIEQLLETDSAIIQRRTKAALQSGALRNMRARRSSPRWLATISIALVPLTLVSLLIVFALPYFFSHEQVEIPVVAMKLPIPEIPVRSQSESVKARAVATAAKARQPLHTQKMRAFPSPAPLTSGERVCITLARLQPEHLEGLLQAQQKFQEDFAREKQNFESKLERERGN
jgi:hypothetical protein